MSRSSDSDLRPTMEFVYREVSVSGELSFSFRLASTLSATRCLWFSARSTFSRGMSHNSRVSRSGRQRSSSTRRVGLLISVLENIPRKGNEIETNRMIFVCFQCQLIWTRVRNTRILPPRVGLDGGFLTGNKKVNKCRLCGGAGEWRQVCQLNTIGVCTEQVL